MPVAAPDVVVVPFELKPVDNTPVDAVGGAATVITVEFCAEVERPEAVSVAAIVAVAPTVAPDATVTRPAASTVATAVFIDVKVSPEAARVFVVWSL